MLFVVPAPASAGAAGQACVPRLVNEYVSLNTYYVDIKPLAKSYSRSDTVKVEVSVTRPARSDPIGLGVPINHNVGVPAPDVTVGVGIGVRRTFTSGAGRTDATGRVTVPVPLRRLTTGVASVRAFAYKEHLNTPCLLVEESGFGKRKRAFTVRG